MKRKFVFVVSWLLFTAGCSRIQEPEFKEINGFGVRNLGLDNVTIGFGMTYFNPNNFSVTVKETGAKVYLDSVYLGEFRQDTAVVVGKKTDFTVPLSGQIPVTTFFQLNVKDIHKRDIIVEAQGDTKIGKAGIFITKKIAYRGKHRLDQINL